MLVVGDIYFFIFGLEDGHQGGELFFCGAGEAPVHERIVGILLEHIPGNQAAGVDKVGFEVSVLGDLFIVEGRRREDVEIFQATALQQFGDRTLQRHAEVRVGAERGEAGAVCRVKQHDADNRILAAQRAIIGKDRKTFGFQFGDRLHDARITRHDLRRYLRQADAFGDDAVFDVALKDFGQALHASFITGVAGGHAVGDIQVADDIHRNIDRFAVGLAGKGQAAHAALIITGLQIHQHAGRQLIVRIVERAQTSIQQAFRDLVVFGQREPLFVRVVNERAISDSVA